ncbi:MAG: PrgI family protein [Microgenomates group bacterium]
MAIQQHPLPQDISSYRFRLIGDMTLKQFASLGICIILAIIVYSIPLPFFFKYPIVFAFLLLGIGMAFLPVQGRSLDIWLIAFIKSIYSPTQYSWKRTPASTAGTETAVPTKENNLQITQPVTNARIEITQPPVISPQQPEIIPTPPVSPPEVTTTVTETVVAPTAVAPTVVVPEPATVIPKATPSPPTPSQPLPPAQSTNVAETPAPTVNLPIPFTPTTPNTLVGLTLTPSGHILDSVLVEIKKDNLTLRATKSNKLGQFMFARPLDSGLFQILAEKEGFSFAPYSLELTGEIVKPLKIQAQ